LKSWLSKILIGPPFGGLLDFPQGTPEEISLLVKYQLCFYWQELVTAQTSLGTGGGG
jgi:hypothetical protein